MEILKDIKYCRLNGITLYINSTNLFSKLLYIFNSITDFEEKSLDHVIFEGQFFSALFEFQVQEMAMDLFGYVPLTLQLDPLDDFIKDDFYRPEKFIIPIEELENIVSFSTKEPNEMRLFASSLTKLFEIEYENFNLNRYDFRNICFNEITGKNSRNGIEKYLNNFQRLFSLKNRISRYKDLHLSLLEFGLFKKLERIIRFTICSIDKEKEFDQMSFNTIIFLDSFFKKNLKKIYLAFNEVSENIDNLEKIILEMIPQNQRELFVNFFLFNYMNSIEKDFYSDFEKKMKKISLVINGPAKILPDLLSKYNVLKSEYSKYKENIHLYTSFREKIMTNQIGLEDIYFSYNAESILKLLETNNLSEAQAFEFVDNLALLIEKTDRSSGIPDACFAQLFQLYSLVSLSPSIGQFSIPFKNYIQDTNSKILETNFHEKFNQSLVYYLSNLKYLNILKNDKKMRIFNIYFVNDDLKDFEILTYYLMLYNNLGDLNDVDKLNTLMQQLDFLTKTQDASKCPKQSIKELFYKIIGYPKVKDEYYKEIQKIIQKANIFQSFPELGFCVESDIDLLETAAFFIAYCHKNFFFKSSNIEKIHFQIANQLSKIVDDLESKFADLDEKLVLQILKTIHVSVSSDTQYYALESNIITCLRLLKLFEKNLEMVDSSNSLSLWKILVKVNHLMNTFPDLKEGKSLLSYSLFNEHESTFIESFKDQDINQVSMCQKLTEKIMDLLFSNEKTFFPTLEALSMEYFNHRNTGNLYIDWVSIIEEKISKIKQKEINTEAIQVIITVLARTYEPSNNVESILHRFVPMVDEYFKSHPLTIEAIHHDRTNLNQIQLMLLWFNSMVSKNQEIQMILGVLNEVPLNVQLRPPGEDFTFEYLKYSLRIRHYYKNGVFSPPLSIGKFSFSINNHRNVQILICMNISNFSSYKKYSSHPLKFVFPLLNIMNFNSM